VIGKVSQDLVVAMSGGVDSSVAALLCAREGRGLAAFTLRLADADPRKAGPGRCCAPRDVRDARRAAAAVGLPHWVLDLRREFEEAVVAPFVDEYLAGRTPVPCIACNDRVKFSALVDRSRALGARRVATGHYARIDRDGRTARLLRGVDEDKDQSYFLHGLSQEQLRRAEFPLGGLTKGQVRALAREVGLSVAGKPESQEICFVPDGDAGAFVEREARRRGLRPRPGPIVGRDGRLLGAHAGVHRYTVGQRRGLGAQGRAHYVLELDAAAARVVAGPAEELGFAACTVERFHWIAGSAPEGGAFEAVARVRHSKRGVPVRVEPRGGGALIEFDEPHRAVSPGQAAVVYRADEVLGGGPIATVVPAGQGRRA
jgi:tRNA-specific 2-thiouridylase